MVARTSVEVTLKVPTELTGKLLAQIHEYSAMVEIQERLCSGRELKLQWLT
ncbi:MAG: hypothetical protein ACT4PT_13195 [Methanobacteriota archaeon]